MANLSPPRPEQKAEPFHIAWGAGTVEGKQVLIPAEPLIPAMK
jgi:hypothetical protein